VAGRDEADACARLREGGFFVERIAPAARAPRIRARTRIATVHRIEFFRQMETLLSSGVLIADALNRLKDRFPDARTRRVLRVVHAQVAESRTSLSQALSLFPGSFPPGVVTAIEAGEEGGAARLAVRFAELAERASTHARTPSSSWRWRRACTRFSWAWSFPGSPPCSAPSAVGCPRWPAA